jgi:hypothetical protein
MMTVNEHKIKHDRAHFVENIALHYEEAEKITLVMDN